MVTTTITTQPVEIKAHLVRVRAILTKAKMMALHGRFDVAEASIQKAEFIGEKNPSLEGFIIDRIAEIKGLMRDPDKKSKLAKGSEA